MKTALIGYSGFVGATLDVALHPTHRYRSTNIDEIQGETFDHVICAGVQAMKWWANKYPEEDLAGIERLLTALAGVKTQRFTLISSIDVYPAPRDVVESSEIDQTGHHAYGVNRLHVEQWVRERFPSVCTLRLPGLFGPGLKKNVIFDMLNDNELEKVHPDGNFQYYDTRLLAADIDKAWDLQIPVLNLSSEPIKTHEIRDLFFPTKQLGGVGPAPASYDMKSSYDMYWGGERGYLYGKESVFERLSDWLKSVRS